MPFVGAANTVFEEKTLETTDRESEVVIRVLYIII